jgi:hypothetical protein
LAETAVTQAGYVAWGRRGMHTKFWWGNMKERYHYESLGVDWRWKYNGTVGCIYLVQNEDKWQAFVHMVLRVYIP